MEAGEGGEAVRYC